MEVQLIELLATGSDGAIIGLLFLAYKQYQIINTLKERVIKLEVELEAYINARNHK